MDKHKFGVGYMNKWRSFRNVQDK